jgi:hypothetical protein
MSDSFDLLGDPVPEGFGKRGRPPHVPTDEKRLKVRVLMAFLGNEAGWEDEVAAGLGISVPTLKKHYFRELKEKVSARRQLKATLLYKLMSESEAGNASAIEKLFKRLDKMELSELEAAVRARGDKREPKGKKELQKEAASEVDGIFAPPTAPSRIN